jgi:DNA-binding Lrp family transcriptional regulator
MKEGIVNLDEKDLKILELFEKTFRLKYWKETVEEMKGDTRVRLER